MDKKSRKPPKPLKILVSLFKSKKSNPSSPHDTKHFRQQTSEDTDNLNSPPIFTTTEDGFTMSVDSVSMAPSTGLELYTELEALHLSRQDNPFIRKVTSQDNLDDIMDNGSFARCGSQSVFSGGSRSLMSPEPLSPTRSCDPSVLEEVHAHLIRSPPPVVWPEIRNLPLSPRSNGTFSPDSTDGLDLDMPTNSVNYYTRSQSEEHILSPSRDHRKPFSPTRGATPDLLMTSSMYGGDAMFASPRNPRQKIKRNHTLNLDCSGEVSNSPFRIIPVGETSMPHTPNYICNTRRNATRQRQKSSGDSFFSSWRLSGHNRRPSSSDAKSMDNLDCGESSFRFGLGSSPGGARKSVCSVGTHSSRGNYATMFTRWKVKEQLLV